MATVPVDRAMNATLPSSALPWNTAWRIARRDLSARFRGLRLLLVCLFLGVAALAAIGTLTGSIDKELSTRGREILGGDIEVTVWQRPLSPAEDAALDALGTLSRGTRMQAMASAGDMAVPIELKAVDGRWPMVGRLRLADGRSVGAPPPGTAWLAEGAAERLGLQPGERFRIGGQDIVIGGIIASEPDRLSEGFALGPTVIVDEGMPRRAGLLAPGSMYRSKVRVALDDPAADVTALADAHKARFESAGLSYRTRDRAAPGAERFVSRMGEFLVLVGLAALVIAGIGIGGGVSSYLEARRTSIATLKVLGATSRDINRIYLLQIATAALAGSLAGLLAGVAVTPLLARALGTLLPVAPGFVLDPLALVKATAYGLLVALVFAAPPLLRARTFPAMALMRARVAPLRARKDVLLPVGGGVAAICAIALASAAQVKVTALFLAGAAVLLGLLGLLGWAIRAGASRVPHVRRPLLRAAIANLHRPGAQTGALVTALGFGLSTFVLLAVVQTALDANIARRVPVRAPDFFVLDVPRDREAEFRTAVLAEVPGTRVRTVPALRGAILAYGPADRMVRVADLGKTPEDAWQLRGERGLTYSEGGPEGNTVTEGAGWPRGYAGEPLVSVDEELARAIDLEVGDRVTVGVLGVERTARVASLRRIDWDSLGFNYVLVFSPNALADAPHNLAATLDLPSGADRGGVLRRLVRAFPSSSVIEVGAILRDARALLGQMSAAIMAAASVAVLAGVAVLLGAIAAARASRLYDNVILRVLGASRRQLLLLQLAEYGALGAVLAGVALVLGSGIGWLILVQMFEFDFLPHWPTVLGVLSGGLLLVILFALAGSLPLLRAKPAQALREL